jgi:hypothetical protein
MTARVLGWTSHVMHATNLTSPSPSWFRIMIVAFVLCLGMVRPGHATWGTKLPDFDAASWKSLGCSASPLIKETSPSAINFVGSASHGPAFYAWDSKYLYFRYRMDKDPYDGCGGWEDYAWTVLLSVPSGSPTKFQWQLSFNGKYKTIELWKNTTQSTIVYNPLFTDDTETKMWSVAYTQTGGELGNTKPFARSLKAGTTFKGTYDYFVDFAIPVKVLVAKGVIASSADLALTSFFPATATKSSNHDRGYLSCPFTPEIECTTASDCSDGNACTTDTCTAGVCGNATIPACTPCGQASDCNDGNACTTDSCNAGVCARTAVPSCTPCTQASDCSDGNACTTESCNAGVCGKTTIPSCTPCTTAAQCGDGNACTTDTCTAGVCGHANIPSCTSCTTAADCQDGNACTDDVCNAGACGHANVADCTPCDVAADCNDDDPCTADVCGQDGSCQVTVIDGCVPCTTAADCNDGDACTTDTCGASGACAPSVAVDGCVACATDTDCSDDDACTTDVCGAGGTCEASTAIDGCIPCTTDGDCNDQNACTTDVCGANGTCAPSTVIDGCVACTTDADCDDQNSCTTDTCAAGACQAQSSLSCTPEVCDNGSDDDTDGAADCKDSDCADAPNCQVEQCGNCVDDDGDGKVDYEDDDCCSQTFSLVLRELRMKMPSGASLNRMSIITRLAAHERATYDPGIDGAGLQISDGMGQVFCHEIPMQQIKRRQNVSTFNFKDATGQLAGGLRKARFRVRSNGSVRFRARGKSMSMKVPEQRDLMVTLRIGSQCMRTMAPLKSKKGHLLKFP